MIRVWVEEREAKKESYLGSEHEPRFRFYLPPLSQAFSHTMLLCTISVYYCVYLPKRMLKWNMKWVVDGSWTNIKESFSLWISRMIHLPQLYLIWFCVLVQAGFSCIFFELLETTKRERHGEKKRKWERYELWTKRNRRHVRPARSKKKQGDNRFNGNVLFIFYNFIYTHRQTDRHVCAQEYSERERIVIAFCSLHFR